MLHMYNCTIEDNNFSAVGLRLGHEFFENKSSLVIDSCRFYRNNGSAIYTYGTNRANNSAYVKVTRSEFRNNKAMNGAAGIFMAFSPIYVNQVTREGTVSLEVDGCRFSKNNASMAVFCQTSKADSSRFLMNNCYIDSNYIDNPGLPYSHGTQAIAISAQSRINKNYILNTRIDLSLIHI